MKLFFDQILSFKLCDLLADLLSGSSQARLVGLERGSDEQIWAFARDNGFVLVTQDADFAEIAAHHGPPPKVVWLKLGNRSTKEITETPRNRHVTIEAFFEDDELYSLALM